MRLASPWPRDSIGGAAVLPADSICYRKQPSVGSGVLRRTRLRVAYEVFVVFTHLSRVGMLREFKLEHGTPRKGLAARVAPGGGAECDASMNL